MMEIDESLLSGLFAFWSCMKLRIANVDDHLDMILPLLSRLVQRDKPDWTIEQALMMCRTGRWLLVVDDDAAGFAFCSLVQAEFSGTPRLVIEAACLENSQAGTAGYESFWDLLAKRMCCTEIVMESKRRGWERRGWRPGWISYSRPVKEVAHV